MNRKERRDAGQRGVAQATHPTVEFAYIHPGDVSAAFMLSLIRCRDYELLRTQNLFGVRERRARSGSIAKARNELVKMFMRSTTEWLWFGDADMGFSRDALQKMLASAHAIDRPIIGGLCFAQRTEGFDEETNAEFFGHIPTISIWEKDDAGEVIAFRTVLDYPRNAVIQVDSTGGAFLLIHRSALKRVQDEFGDNWFTQIQHPTKDEPFGEDTSFFIRCDQLGIPLHINTGVRTSHDKGGIFLTEQTFDLQQRTREMLADEGEALLAQ